MSKTEKRGPVTLITEDGEVVNDPPHREPDKSVWPTRTEVSNLLGYSLNKVILLEKTGRLHPSRDAEGARRYDPDEVGMLCVELGIDEDKTPEWKARAYGRLDLFASLSAYKMAGETIKAVTQRQAQLDEGTNKYIQKLEARIERYEAENDRLREKLENGRRATESALEQQTEREAFSLMVKAREERMTRVVGSLVQNIQRALFGEQKEVSFDQLSDGDKDKVITAVHIRLEAEAKSAEEELKKREAAEGKPDAS